MVDALRGGFCRTVDDPIRTVKMGGRVFGCVCINNFSEHHHLTNHLFILLYSFSFVSQSRFKEFVDTGKILRRNRVNGNPHLFHPVRIELYDNATISKLRFPPLVVVVLYRKVRILKREERKYQGGNCGKYISF